MNQIIRKLERWYFIDPEFQSYLPEHHEQYRHPSPASQPSAKVPHQAFMKEYQIKYYDRDYRKGHIEGRKPVILYRQLVIENPLRIRPGETVGPFYGHGFEKKKAVGYHEKNNKQVYSYNKDRYPYKPADRPAPDEALRLEEEQLLYKELHQDQQQSTQKLSQ